MVHVFDRGFAGAPWLKELSRHQLRFIVRWPTRYHLMDEKGERPAWQITRGKRSQDHRQIWDLHRRQYRKTGIVAVPVRHPQMDDALWLVVSRPGRGRKPWYLLTNEAIETVDDAWRVVFAYARRWQVEMCYRACKTDLAMESPRLWFWKNRLKLLLMVSLVYAFLLSLLAPDLAPLVQDLFRRWCHRTGKRYRQAAIPLSRLRAALSALWLTPSPGLHYPLPKFGMTHVLDCPQRADQRPPARPARQGGGAAGLRARQHQAVRLRRRGGASRRLRRTGARLQRHEGGRRADGRRAHSGRPAGVEGGTTITCMVPYEAQERGG